MEVILIQKIQGVGDRFEIIRVADGYARNFLIPNGLAKPATPQEVKLAALMRLEEQRKQDRMKREKEEIKEKLKTVTLEFHLKADDSGRLYGSLTKSSVVTALQALGLYISPNQIKFEKTIKEVGEGEVLIELGSGERLALPVKIMTQ